jgi:uncharacterized membrane protein HdeD (DUF308 family)
MTSSQSSHSPHTTTGPLFLAPLLHGLAQNWWVFLFRGILAIAVGVLAFAWPGITLVSLVLLFGIYAAADGILAIASAITGHTLMPRWWLAIVGIAGLGAAFTAFTQPGLTLAVLLLVIAVWAIALGIMQIIGAVQLRKEIDNEWFLGLSGLCAVIFGAILLFRPGAGTLALIFTLGTFAVIEGLLLVAFSIRLKGHTHAEVRTAR